MVDGMLCGILYMEYESPEAAVKYAKRFGGCPRVYFWATMGNDAYILLAIPERERYWAEYIGEHPEPTFGGVKADLVFAEIVHTSGYGMRVPEEPGDVSPCGSHCVACPAYTSDSCVGCPATVHYKP